MPKTKKSKRYDGSALEEQFEPGSRGRVLRNLLGIQRKREMEKIEAREQRRARQELIPLYGETHRFTAADIRKIHRIWLGPIYAWAGQYRKVNISKRDVIFPAATEIRKLMVEFEGGPLRQFTPCRLGSVDELVRAITVVNTELMLIHPFREGNGRVGRLLAVLMAHQAKLPRTSFRVFRE